jgi:undecaprenyl-diphosphatase
VPAHSARVNYQLFEMINGLAGRADSVDDVLEFAANWLIYGVFGVVAVLVAVAVRRRRLRPAVRLGAALFLAFAAATILGHLSGEVRPFQGHSVHQLVAHEPGASMPSDHATAAFTLAFGVLAFFDRRWGVVLTAAAVAIGFARVWVGVHYPGDVLAGAIIAGLAVLTVAAVAAWTERNVERAGLS